ncbi:hypothetical protein ACWEPN_15525 [Nonomuraea wenchangensis]
MPDPSAEQTIRVKGEPIDALRQGPPAPRHTSANNGLPLWIAEVEPGSAHNLTAACLHVLGAPYASATSGLRILADNGYDGAGIGIHASIKQPEGTSPQPG